MEDCMQKCPVQVAHEYLAFHDRILSTRERSGFQSSLHSRLTSDDIISLYEP